MRERPHQRKRKRYTLDDGDSEPPTRHLSHGANQNHPADHHAFSAATSQDPPTMRKERPSMNDVNVSGHQMSIVLDSASATEYSYVGRSAYLGGQIRFTEDLARSDPQPSSDIPLSDVSLHLLHVQHALDLPTRPIRTGLVAAFMERIHPWTPVVEPSWLVGHSDTHAWLLLQQSVFLAASRVSQTPLNYASPQEFYTRARTLFFHGSRGNTLLSIVAALLLQWWHPEGPEKVSIDSSGFWSRIGIELAYQMGLHIEPEDKPHRAFRRRLWWSLVVRLHL